MTRLLALALLRCSAPPRPLAAQDWPTKTVRFIVPFGAGSTPDIIARLIADKLQQKLGQTFVVENKAGASGMTGTDAVAKAEPDGHTIGISLGGALAINTLLFSKMPYDPAKEIALITHPDQPAERARGAGEPRRQQRRRAGRAAEEGPRQIQFRLDRQRLAVASRHGGDRAEERHQADPRALRLLAAGDDRADPRRRADRRDAGDLGACRTRSPAR